MDKIRYCFTFCYFLYNANIKPGTPLIGLILNNDYTIITRIQFVLCSEKYNKICGFRDFATKYQWKAQLSGFISTRGATEDSFCRKHLTTINNLLLHHLTDFVESF